MDKMLKCRTCRYFVSTGTPFSAASGECRRNAPLVCLVEPPSIGPGLFKSGGRTETRWPAVTDNDFCGEWEPTDG